MSDPLAVVLSLVSRCPSQVDVVSVGSQVKDGDDTSPHYIAVGLSGLEGNTWDGAVEVLTMHASGPPPTTAAPPPPPPGGAGAGAGAAGGPRSTNPASPVKPLARVALAGGVSDVAWVKRTTLVAGCDNGDVKVLKVVDGSAELKVITTLGEHEDMVTAVASCVDAHVTRAASASWDCTVKLWDFADPTSSILTLWGHAGPIHSLDWCPVDADRLLTTSKDGSAKVWSQRESKAVVTISPEAMPTSAVWHPTVESEVAVGSEDGTVAVYDVRRASEPVGVKTKHDAAVFRLAYSPSGEVVASASDDSTVRATSTTKSLGMNGHTDYVRGVSWMGSNHLLTGSWDKTVRHWALPGEL